MGEFSLLLAETLAEPPIPYTVDEADMDSLNTKMSNLDVSDFASLQLSDCPTFTLSNAECAKINFEVCPKEVDEILRKQDSRKVSAFEAYKLEKDAKRNWDIFYKRNETRFFKDRHWTLREFQEILSKKQFSVDAGMEVDLSKVEETKTSNEGSSLDDYESTALLEIGCGVGNFAFPILEAVPKLKIWACDFSPRAVEFVKANPEYNEERMRAFVCDVVQDNCFASQELLLEEKVDFISLIFVLSAISPEKHACAIKNLIVVSKPGTVVCFRDYGRYDMAQLRFKGGKKIQDNFYARRDGTCAYYFTPEEVTSLFVETGQFKTIQCDFLHRRTVNVKENVDVLRVFVQGKFVRV